MLDVAFAFEKFWVAKEGRKRACEELLPLKSSEERNRPFFRVFLFKILKGQVTSNLLACPCACVTVGHWRQIQHAFGDIEVRSLAGGNF